MRVAATSGSERLGRTGLTVARHPVDLARRAPLPIVGISLSSIGSSIDDDAVVAVAVGDIDTPLGAGDRIR